MPLPSWTLRVGIDSTFSMFPNRQTSGRMPSNSHPLSMVSVNSTMALNAPTSRFDRTADRDMKITEECLLEIDGKRYNLTAWAKAHPGGVNVLRKFHNKDASTAFHAAGHSAAAYEMLKDFLVVEDDTTCSSSNKCQELSVPSSTSTTTTTTTSSVQRKRPRWIQKLFTKEDPIGVHKYLGIFCLLNFAYRFGHLYFGDMAAGLGSSTKSIWPMLALFPHALLSLSSLIFHTVPRERVVGKPMIWQEYRIHNIGFGVRSVICSLLAWISAHYSPQPGSAIRRLTVAGSCLTCLVAFAMADMATRRLQPSQIESTTATMPYWDGCSVATQKRFKLFYAYCQFMATLACLAVGNPAWPLAVLLAIQTASLLMTLVRKGIVSARGYHIGYTIALLLPYYVGFRCGAVNGHWVFPSMLALGAVLFWLRRLGISKFALWIPVIVARILIGDKVIPFESW